mmetsp:Transcript_60158/g.131780  ORF Transcript_60158/g.131780 Transcript_60158/m.131780 type:complete len:250 (+) Transcript_60158:504-1253(+)
MSLPHSGAKETLGTRKVLGKAFYPQEVALSNGCCHIGITTGRNLHKSHLRKTHLVAIIFHTQPHQLYSLGHPGGVDLCHLPSHLDVVQRCRTTALWHSQAFTVPVAHSHQGPGVLGHGGCIEVQHTEALILVQFRRVVLQQVRVENSKRILRFRIALVCRSLKMAHGLIQVSRNLQAGELHLTQQRPAGRFIATCQFLKGLLERSPSHGLQGGTSRTSILGKLHSAWTERHRVAAPRHVGQEELHEEGP